MRILILTVIMVLPLMAFGQKEEQPQQPQQQPQAPTNEAPAATEKEQPAQPATKPQTTNPARAVDERKQTDVKDGAQVNKSKAETRAESANDKRVAKDVKSSPREVDKTEAATRSSTSTTKTKVSVQEFKSRHSDVFSLGRHPRDYFIQRYGEKHFREIGDTYFVFLDGCWVAVNVDGFGYTERVICEGDSDFVEVVD